MYIDKMNLINALICGVFVYLVALMILLPVVTILTRFWENDPNCTSVKIKLTPPANSYTTTLLVQTLSITQTGFNRRLFWEAHMVVFGLLKGLDSREPVVTG